MRLVQIGNDGALTVTSDLITQNNLPPYAILSHTWQAHDQEVSFDDLQNNTGHEKAGYAKLRFCAQQARIDGLSYFWLDTCCIDIGNHTELQEAINSTFRWAQNATKCYVILSDVPKGSAIADSGIFNATTSEVPKNSWEPAFRASRWFTRSWTLQELLAPPAVEFFSRYGGYLGNRSSLAATICEITDIPVAALQGVHLSEFSVEQKLSWGQNRHATRDEDPAYSLLGIFDVFVPIIYGEGQRRAFSRLRKAIEWSSGKDTREEHFRTRYQVLYHPLGRADIRILVLHPGEQNDDLRADLEPGNLSGILDYQALSYVWGQEPALHALRINGSETIFIKPNLFHALHRLRLPYGSVRLWIDSICINQSDESERNQQVEQMGEIFRHARNVWIWLGEEYADSNYAMDILPQVNRPGYDWKDLWSNQRDFLAINQLLARPWFRRGWVIQEVAFASNSIIFCGNRRVDWRDLAKSVERIKRHVDNALLRNHALGIRSVCNNLYESSASKLFDIVTGVFQLQRDGHVNKMLSLETLVGLATSFETTDPRDTIYALINLANDTDSASSSNSLGTIVPDYRKKPTDVFTEFILHCSHVSGSLDIICRPWAPRLDYQNREVASKGSPSWIQTRHQLPFGDPSERNNHRLHSNSLVEDCRRPIYAAHYYKSPQVHTPKQPGMRLPHDPSMVIRGVVIGAVRRTSLRMADAIITKDCLRILDVLSQKLDCVDSEPTIRFSRIFCAEIFHRHNEFKEDLDEEDMDIDIEVVSWWKIMLSRLNSGDPGIDIEECLEKVEPGQTKEYLEIVQQCVWNRRTFSGFTKRDASSPIAGLAPQRARIGDHICILYGCSVPVVLRRFEASSEGTYWRLIGEAYVYGYMDGEAISSMTPEELPSEEVDFEIR